MKRKFLILTLCFTLFFTSINYKKSYADGGVISLPILATVSALAVGTGIVISNDDDLYDLGRMFYDYVDKHNTLTWQTVQSVFISSVSLQANKLVSVKSEFLDIVRGFFDNTFSEVNTDINLSAFSYPSFSLVTQGNYGYININDLYSVQLRNKNGEYTTVANYKWEYDNGFSVYFAIEPYDAEYVKYYYYTVKDGVVSETTASYKKVTGYVLGSDVFPYNGGYTWDNLESKKENESIALPVPGDLGQLVGQGNSDFWDNTDGLVGTGGITIPGVDNPSISVDNTISFPNVEDVPDTDVPDVDVPGTDIIIPSFPSFGDSLDFSPMYLTNVTEKFPFSLPWDIGRLIQKFDVEPKAPIFEVPILSETIILDLTEFSELASIVRFFVLIGFILSLIFISTKLMA